MRTITLELLRHGTAHNQLLSPLTPYLALCENHEAVTLNLPFEHNQFLHRLSALSYRLEGETGSQSRIFELKETARILSEILSKIPGLTAESNKRVDGEENLTHLRLIISASELALLPFELVLAPNGLPGAGQHLLLQPQSPICLTREIRRVSDEKGHLLTQPKILFAAAAPSSVGAIPLESHLLALRRSISPWVKYYKKDNEKDRQKRVEEHLHFLPNASIEAIEEACASGNYTHVHILAHGVEVKKRYSTHFLMALHNSRVPENVDYIDGTRLATAVRASTRPDNQGLSLPVVVTLASCDSGNVGSITDAGGASIAHSLHESGIPMVIAGQFPLSFEGSVRLVECLYEGLLWGTDPRLLLYDLRRRLYAQFDRHHDWASLVAYVSLPSDFDDQLKNFKIDQAGLSIDAAMNHADEATRNLSEILSDMPENTGLSDSTPSDKNEDDAAKKPKKKKAAEEDDNQKNEVLVESALEKIKKAKKKYERLLEFVPEQSARIYGRLATTEKRHAEVLFRATAATNKEDKLFDKIRRERYRKEHSELLQKARDYYWQSFLLNRGESWALVQYLSLTLIMQRGTENYESLQKTVRLSDVVDEKTGSGKEYIKKDPASLWFQAHSTALYELNSSDPTHVIWGHGNLIELHLLSVIGEEQASSEEAEHSRQINYRKAERLALEYSDELIDLAGRNSFMVYATRRQILRYIEWFSVIADLGEQTKRLAQNIFDRFPPEVEDKWR